MSVPVPTATTRRRCALCGNPTRFDGQSSTPSREFVPVTMAGEPAVEERQVAETIEHVTCRWCGRADEVELVPRPGLPGAPDPASAPGAGEPAEHPAGS